MPDLTPSQVQLQAYQGQADTAFPYYNLASNFQPLYGQIASGLAQQQPFGYDTGTGQPLTSLWRLCGNAGWPGRLHRYD